MKKLILLLLTLGIGKCLYCQYFDYGQAAQQMVIQNQMETNNLLNQMFGILNQQNQQYEKDMQIYAHIIPAGNDVYRTFAMVSYPGGIKNLRFLYCDNVPSYDGKLYWSEYNPQSLTIAGQYVMLPADLKPGYRVRIDRKEGNDTKVFFDSEIPKKGTTAYESFKIKANSDLNNINNALNGGSSNNSYNQPSNSSSYSGTRSRAQIEADINKTKQRIIENKGNLNSLNYNSTLRPTYERMIQEDNNRVLELEREKSRAAY